MPTNLTDDATTFSSPVQVPAAGDARTDTSVATPFQQLANRTANTKTRVDAVVPFSAAGYTPALPAGVSIGSVPLVATSVAVMQTIPAGNRFDGMLCLVKDYGVFQFDAANTAGASAPWIIQPTDVVGGPGRWFLLPYGALGGPGGFMQGDSSSRLGAGLVRNGIVGIGHVEAGPFSTNATSYVDVTGSAITFGGLLVGDIVLWDYSSAVSLQASSVLYTLGLVVRPDSSTVQPSNFVSNVSNVTGSVSVNQALNAVVGTYVATQSGSHTFKIQAQSDSGAHTQSILNLNARAIVIRP